MNFCILQILLRGYSIVASGGKYEKNKRLIPYRTVKGEGILWAFKPDEIYVEGIKSTKSIYVALYEDSLKSKNYHGLIPASIL